MFNWIRSIFCEHQLGWIGNIYGDEINHLGARSVWRCQKCDKAALKDHLGEPTPKPMLKAGTTNWNDTYDNSDAEKFRIEMGALIETLKDAK